MHREMEGKYFGTEINEKWWKRYTKDKMFARGNGRFSFDEQSISFLRRLTKSPIKIKFSEILEFKTGSWHAGQWGAGRPIIKVIWKKNGQILSSGFTISKNPKEVTEMTAALMKMVTVHEGKTALE